MKYASTQDSINTGMKTNATIIERRKK